MDWQFSIEWILGGVIAVIVWLGRQAFRIEKRVSSIESGLAHAKQLRELDHESISEIKSDVKEVKKILMEAGK